MEKLGPNIVIMNIRLAIFRTDFSLWEVTSFEAKILVTLKPGSIGSDIIYSVYHIQISYMDGQRDDEQLLQHK